MSASLANNRIKIEGNALTGKYSYCSSGKKYAMGTIDMYKTFTVNFSDSNVTLDFFNKEEGIKLLEVMLTTIKCNLFNLDDTNDPLYLSFVNQSFDIIRLYFSSITNARNREIFTRYSKMIPKIRDKSVSLNVKDTPIKDILIQIANILVSSERTTVRDVSQILSTQGSMESARTKVVNFSTIGKISDTFLSPVDPFVFEEFREYCIRHIGEGTKVSEESGHNIETMRNNLLQVFSIFKDNLKMVEKDSKGNFIKEVSIKSFNSNDIENVNRVLICFLQKPENVQTFLKIMEKAGRFYPDQVNELVELKNIFQSNFVFDYSLHNNSYNKYIGGSKTSESLIIKKVTIKEEIFPVKKSSKEETSKQFEEEPDKEIIEYEKGKKGKPDIITKVLSRENDYKIDIKIIKTIMSILTSAPDKFASSETKKKAKELYDSVMEGSFGEVKAEVNLDWWQKLFIEMIKAGKSFILVGDTSGGKTFISMMGIRILFNAYLNDTSAKFIYLAPTSQLAILQFANILKAYPSYSQYFGLCCKSIVNIPPTARILIGTPNEVKKYMYQVKYQHNTVISLENISEEIKNAVENPFMNTCKILFIDEIQTLSPTYVQSQEIEQVMECKAIEEIIKCVSYKDDKQSQVIGMSATLSRESIVNIKTKITNLTGIPDITDIVYSHEDIGLDDLSKKSTYIPIMKKPIIVPIKISGKVIENYREKDKIIQQTLNNESIEMIVRDAAYRKVLPLSVYREDELTTIQMYKDFISYLERKETECRIWQNLRIEYMNEVDSHGSAKMKEPDRVNLWITRIRDNIMSIIHNDTIDTVVHKGDFDNLLATYHQLANEDIANMNPILSPELYGLIYEYISFTLNHHGFQKEIHPYYRFGVVRGDEFFNLKNPNTNTDSTFKKILVAQQADPASNTGSIIPLIMRGIRFGVGLVTSSIPLGFQLEIFKFINIKSKQTGESAPIPILFCEYGMSMGVNFALMSVAILRMSLCTIGPSELKQIMGRAGRRGNSSGAHPVVYTFNITNVYNATALEVLDFNVDNISSSFFDSNEIYETVCKLIVKFENNKDAITDKNIALCETIISGDSFKKLGGSDVLLVRKIQLAKYQVRELFDICKNIFPKITEEYFRELYNFLQKSEFYNLNVQIS